MNRVYTPEEYQIIKALYDSGATYQAIGDLIGRTVGAISYFLHVNGLKNPSRPRSVSSKATQSFNSRRQGKKNYEKLKESQQKYEREPVECRIENGVRIEVFPRGYAWNTLTWRVEI